MVYLNPGGFNFGPENLDGYGISNIVFGVTYSLFFYAACIFLWIYRKHPVVKMRNVPLLLMSLLTLHVFMFMVFVVYTLNGAFPCQVEYWCMSLYLPIGIGLFQAQNQQLLVVSSQQNKLLVTDELFKSLPPKPRKGAGSLNYWIFRLKCWWRDVSTTRKYEMYVTVGMVVQFVVSFIIYNISRKFNHYGVVSKHEPPGLCRRGWEWAPSVIWQFLWNFFFGPYLLWKIRLIRDIYHWRLQTTLAIIAGLPGTPLWLASVYTNSFGPMNKYWIPAMWFVPGMMTMEIVTLGFPIYQIYKHKKSARETHRALAEFDQKRLNSIDNSTTTGSLTTRSTTSKRRKMFSMESLDSCLSGSHDTLQIYASCMELNGENIIFLTRVLEFKRQCEKVFHATCKSTTDFQRARTVMFRVGLSIFVSLVHSRTASYPINIESTIYNRLDAIFGPATALVAVERKGHRSPSIASGNSNPTPWDEPSNPIEDESAPAYPMQAMNAHRSLSRPGTGRRHNIATDSCEHIIELSLAESGGENNRGREKDPLDGVKVPADFDEAVFNAAFQSVRYMVWTETWQRFMAWKNKGGVVDNA